MVKTHSKFKMKNPKLRLRTGDTVRVILGKDRGKKGKVLAILPRDGRVLVEGVGMVKKHVRPKRAGEKGQRVATASPLRLSNVQLVCAQCKKSTRVGIRRQDGAAIRFCKKCSADITE
jgi:large subunit ribosomal protein L24